MVTHKRCIGILAQQLYVPSDGYDLKFYADKTPDGPVVIEVNEFPNYISDVPSADEELADDIVWLGGQHRQWRTTCVSAF